MSEIEISSLPLNLQTLARRYDKNRNGKIDGNEVFLFQQARSNQKSILRRDEYQNKTNLKKIDIYY